jgi:hypothetical protein
MIHRSSRVLQIGKALKMHQLSSLIAFGQKNIRLHKYKLQQGAQQPCRKASDQGAGHHMFHEKPALVAGKSGRMAHIMGRIMQTLALRKTCRENQCQPN